MSLTEDAPVPLRRRGAALEGALLDAAWDDLIEKGYDAFTIESVAERAQTARAVIYRRWATKPELVCAAIAHHGLREHVSVPDTGSLRSDLGCLYLLALADDGALQRLEIVPLRLRRFRLERADADARAWLRRMFDEEGRALGTRVEEAEDGRFALRWD